MHRIQPYHLDDPMGWAVEQERQRHDDALWQLGELAALCLLWNIEDFNAGMVEKCTTCSSSSRISDAYNQPGRNKCPDCFGTNFRGGYRALIIRPCIITDGDGQNALGPRGVSHPKEVSFESTNDFKVRPGDYLFRANGARYQLRQPSTTTLRTGFSTPYHHTHKVGYHLNDGALEDPTSVAYMIPPIPSVLEDILVNRIRVPEDKNHYEDIRGPLLLEEHGLPGSRREIVNTSKTLSGDPENPYGTD